MRSTSEVICVWKPSAMPSADWLFAIEASSIRTNPRGEALHLTIRFRLAFAYISPVAASMRGQWDMLWLLLSTINNFLWNENKMSSHRIVIIITQSIMLRAVRGPFGETLRESQVQCRFCWGGLTSRERFRLMREQPNGFGMINCSRHGLSRT